MVNVLFWTKRRRINDDNNDKKCFVDTKLGEMKWKNDGRRIE